jgi:hypothetical protein
MVFKDASKACIVASRLVELLRMLLKQYVN